MLLRLFYFLFFALLPVVADARLITQKKDGVLLVKSATYKETEDLFRQYGYGGFSEINSRFPRIYFLRLPTDWAEIPESDDKHRVFIKILLPLILQANENVLKERSWLEDMRQKTKSGRQLTAAEQKKLEKLAQKYDAFTRLKGTERIAVQLKLLLEKADTVPPSLLAATAGIYSNWGTSRLALQANSLYLQEIWYEKQGLEPLDDPDADYRYKIYGNLAEGIADHILKINSSINYNYLRVSRTNSRKMGRPLYGPQVAATMMLDNNLKNIAGMIDYTFSYYKLQNADYKPQLEDVK